MRGLASGDRRASYEPAAGSGVPAAAAVRAPRGLGRRCQRVVVLRADAVVFTPTAMRAVAGPPAPGPSAAAAAHEAGADCFGCDAAVTASGVTPETRPAIPMAALLSNRCLSAVRPAGLDFIAAAELAASNGSRCRSMALVYDVGGKHVAQIQRELRKRLHDDLVHGRDNPAFCWVGHLDEDRPMANDLEGMYAALPRRDTIDFGAPDADSPQDLASWRELHSLHCTAGCTASRVSPGCYFWFLHHYLRAGFEPPVLEGVDVMDLLDRPVAYVDLWMQHEAKCDAAFSKWKAQAGSFMSAPTKEVPEVVFPILPVVKPKDLWRWVTRGEPCKARLCLDSKCGGLNEKYCDWRFRYRPIEEAIGVLRPRAVVACIDIAAFFNKLAAGPALQKMQHFQCPGTYARSDARNRQHSSRRAYRHLRCCGFGNKLVPAYASTVSAELVRILEAHGIGVAGCMMDDILLYRNDGDAAALNAQLRQAEQIMERLGLPSNDKTQPASRDIVYLGYLISTTGMTITIPEVHREYALARLDEMLGAGVADLRTLRSVAGVLTWLSSVLLSGKPRRQLIFAAIAELDARPALLAVRRKTPAATTQLRGDLRRQLEWWRHVLRTKRYSGSRCFAPRERVEPAVLIRSDASDEMGWGLCIQGFHVFGLWPAALAGSIESNMLFKELLPVAVAVRLFGAHREGCTFASATDNAGVAFVVNALRAKDPMANRLLQHIADASAEYSVVVLSSHARRERNVHADWLSRSVPVHLWQNLAAVEGRGRTWEFPLAIVHVGTGEMYTARLRL